MNKFVKYLEKNNFCIVSENQDAVYKIVKFIEVDKEIDEENNVFLLVGPSGNGKTILVKYAMNYAEENGKQSMFVATDTIRENIISHLIFRNHKNHNLYIKEMCRPYLEKDFVVIDNIESLFGMENMLIEVLRIIRELQLNGIKVIIISTYELKRKLECEKINFDEVEILKISNKSKLEITSKICEYYGLTLLNNFVEYISANARRIGDIQSILREIRFREKYLNEMPGSDIVATVVKKHCKMSKKEGDVYG